MAVLHNRRYSTQTFGPGTAEQLLQNSFSLVIEGVRGRNGVQLPLLEQVVKEGIAEIAGGFLDSLVVLLNTRWNIDLPEVEWQLVCGRQRLNEIAIVVGFHTTQAMVNMNDGKHEPESLPTSQQSEQECDRVGASGDSDAEAQAGIQLLLLKREGDRLRHSEQMVEQVEMAAARPQMTDVVSTRTPAKLAVMALRESLVGADRSTSSKPFPATLVLLLTLNSRGIRKPDGLVKPAFTDAPMWDTVSLYTPVVMQVFVILPAAGLGTRMSPGHATPKAAKQFLTLGGIPILIHSLRAFASVQQVTAIYVAVRKSEMARARAQMTEYGLGTRVQIVEGGDTRQESVSRALAALPAHEDADIVLVHDAVRPLIDAETIARTIDAVARHGAAIVGLPAIDTIKQVERTADGAIIRTTIPREYVVQAQTPQGFHVRLLKKAFAEAEADGFCGTDEASLVERAGSTVAVVPGSAANMKITHPGDLDLAEFYLARRKTPETA